MSRTCDVSIVICAYTEDRLSELLAAIDSIRRQVRPAGEIIVVADHNPSLYDAVRAAATDVIVVHNGETRGLAGARNSGVAAADGDVIAFLDDDAMAAPDWLQRLCDGYQDPTVLGVGGTVEPVWLAGRPRWFPEEFDWVVGCTFRGMPESTMPVARLVGANMSFRREVFKAVGGFRSGLGRVGTRPIAGEETEFCIRAMRHWPGRHFIYDPNARVYHRVTVTRSTWGYFRARCYGEGLSKALVSRSVGANAGLASERAYTLRTLPRGVAHGVSDGLRLRDTRGLARAGAILAGLTITATGFIAGSTLSRMYASVEPLPGEIGMRGSQL